MIPLLADPAPGLLRAAPIDPSGHTMSRERLLRYLEIKVHHLIQDHGWDSIRVIGGYDRTTIVSRYEKGGKLFNTERPTAEVHGHDLVVKAFPGADYVQHYALIIASYLAMTGRPADRVTFGRLEDRHRHGVRGRRPHPAPGRAVRLQHRRRLRRRAAPRRTNRPQWAL
ncbi:hypothetical protein ACFY2M_26225 [Streptomyces sp. NPDC001276]|uniref:hypothetical protein n=1 Tax=Streptomyces sp. NPDC001276 TaxID=3364555 RepID=UPI0036C594F5